LLVMGESANTIHAKYEGLPQKGTLKFEF